jgi:hypothetical protein
MHSALEQKSGLGERNHLSSKSAAAQRVHEMSYIDTLIENCEAAKAAQPSKVMEIDGMGLSRINGIERAIYIIEEIDGDPNKTFSAFSRYKGKKERSCSKMNAPSKVMYVGSSRTGVKKRIEQHMGQGYKGTYALHLSHWFNGKYKITVQEYNVSDDVLQIIEDDLSDKLKPAFGKQGSNNK